MLSVIIYFFASDETVYIAEQKLTFLASSVEDNATVIGRYITLATGPARG